MAKKTIIDAITKLYSKLGGNISDVLGTRSNVNFMGTGKTSEGFLDMDLNVNALGSLSQSKAVDELKSAVGFATADKLNDLQANKLLTNMMRMDEFYNPTPNITDMATGTRNLDNEGLAALRERTGDTPLTVPGLRDADGVRPAEKSTMMNPDGTVVQDSNLMKRLDDIVKRKQGKRMLDEDEIADLSDDVGDLDAYSDFDGTLASANRIRKEHADYVAEMRMEYQRGNLDPAPGEANRETFLRRKFDEMEASGDRRLMTRDEIEELNTFDQAAAKTPFDEAVEYNPTPGDTVQNLVDQKFGIGYFDNIGATPSQRGSAREFLVEALKKESPNQTNFSDIIDAVDVKYITEGGGGLAGDPLTIVNKYFGPRIAEMVPSGASSEEIAIFTERVLNNVVDANGLRPGDPRFDRLTAKFTENFAEGGLAGILNVGREGYAEGGAIYPRLSTLSSGVESAEQQLQTINTALQEAESNLGSGSSEGDTAITGGPSFTESFEETDSPNFFSGNTFPITGGGQPPMLSTGIPPGGGSQLGTPEERDQFKIRTIEERKQIAEDMNNSSGGGLMKNDGTRVPITYEQVGDGSNTMPSMPMKPKSDNPFGNIMQATPSTGGGPSLTQTADPAREAYDKAVQAAKKQRAEGFMGRVVLPGERSFEDFSSGFNYMQNNPNSLNQLQGIGGGLMGSLGGFNVQKPVLSIGNTGQNRSPFARGGLAKILEV